MTTRQLVRPMSLVLAMAFTLVIADGQQAKGDITSTSAGLPPTTSTTGTPAYLSPAAVHAMYSGAGLTAVLSEVQHKAFSDININFVSGTTGVINQQESFHSVLTGLVSLNGGPDVAFTLTGPVGITVFDRSSDSQTGTFNTQMTSMDMTGTVAGHSVEVTLDSALGNSTGQTTITDISGGKGTLFDIHSFFDVFTQLSLDGGPFIAQTNGPTLVQLGTVPEPSAWILYVAAGLMVPAYARWGRRRG